MNISQLLFSAQGRISRSTFWLKFFLPYVAIIFVLAILDIMMKTFSEEIGLGLFSGAFILISLYSSIVVSIKRLHDRNKSGWWYLLALVPIVGSIWFLIECGILKGTTGDNKYGPDPLTK